MKNFEFKEYVSSIYNLKNNPDVIFQENEVLIKSKYNDITELMMSAQNALKQGKLLESSKAFRQLAKNIQELYFKIEKKGTHSKRNTLNDLSGKEWLRHTKSWVIVDGKPSDIPIEIKDHPASFPPELIEYFIDFFTKKRGWVLDPFIGIGSTAVACKNIQRNCWGTEINPKYYSFAIKRLKRGFATLNDYIENSENKESLLVYKIFNRDCHDILKLSEENKFPPIDFCITSPPYWNILGASRGGVKSTHKKRIENGLDEKYSNEPNDIGNISNYEEYLKEIEVIFKDVFKLLKSGGYLMIILQNIRPKGGIMIPIAWDLAKLLSKTYKLRQEFIWCQNQKQLGIWGYPKTYVSNVHHHYCLVFSKS